MRDLPQPLETGATARYRWDDALARRLWYTDRFGEVVDLAERRGDELHAPRALAPIGVVDDRVDGEPIDVVSTLVPRSAEQGRVIAEATRLLMAGRSFRLEAPTGFGKTAVACAVIANVGRRTAVVFHKTDLMEQWRDALVKFTDLEPEDVGTIQGPTCDVEGRKVALCMIQTLTSRDFSEELLASFGLVVWDECHHLGADVFGRSASMFPARLRLGLSATPERADGRERTIEAHIGPVAVRAQARTLRPLGFVYASSWRCPRKRDGQKLEAQAGRTMHFEKSLARDPRRNALLLDLILKAHGQGRRTVVFSALIAHLEALRGMAIAAGVPESDTVLYVNRTPAAEREAGKARPLIFATYGMLSEGTDIPELDCALLATPRARIKQAVGRVLRELPGKPRPVVLDVQDDDAPVFRDYARSRLWQYRQMGAELHARGGRIR